MPEKATLERARRDKRQGKAASTQAGSFVREEISHVRKGKHGAKNAKQAIAIGLSKARRAGVKLQAPAKGKASPKVRAQAKRDLAKGQGGKSRKTSAKRSKATLSALKRQPARAASYHAISRQVRAAQQRGTQPRSKRMRK